MSVPHSAVHSRNFVDPEDEANEKGKKNGGEPAHSKGMVSVKDVGKIRTRKKKGRLDRGNWKKPMS